MNAQPQEKTDMTPEEYLALERSSIDIKHEYYGGEIFAMTGAKTNHVLINTNITAGLHNRFVADNSTCRIFSNDMRVKIESKSGYVYPDIAVACGDIEFEDNQFDTLTNPIVIIEILSDSTEVHDRTEKFDLYREIPTLQDYILVSQNKCRVEHHIKGPDMWGTLYYTDMEQILKVESIGCEIAISEIYRWIEFESDTPADK